MNGREHKKILALQRKEESMSEKSEQEGHTVAWQKASCEKYDGNKLNSGAKMLQDDNNLPSDFKQWCWLSMRDSDRNWLLNQAPMMHLKPMSWLNKKDISKIRIFGNATWNVPKTLKAMMLLNICRRLLVLCQSLNLLAVCGTYDAELCKSLYRKYWLHSKCRATTLSRCTRHWRSYFMLSSFWPVLT